jgi:hypothetical protein
MSTVDICCILFSLLLSLMHIVLVCFKKGYSYLHDTESCMGIVLYLYVEDLNI